MFCGPNACKSLKLSLLCIFLVNENICHVMQSSWLHLGIRIFVFSYLYICMCIVYLCMSVFSFSFLSLPVWWNKMNILLNGSSWKFCHGCICGQGRSPLLPDPYPKFFEGLFNIAIQGIFPRNLSQISTAELIGSSWNVYRKCNF